MICNLGALGISGGSAPLSVLLCSSLTTRQLPAPIHISVVKQINSAYEMKIVAQRLSNHCRSSGANDLTDIRDSETLQAP